MALTHRSLKCCVPLLLALVILFSLFPAVPVFASEGSYNYFVDIDGSSFTYSTTAESITLDLIITANDYKISVDGSEEDYRISDTVLNNDKQKFAGLSVNGQVDQVDYGIGTHTITLNSSSPTLFLGTVWKSPLYVDPNGGTWNGSSSTSVFWELPNTDTDEIYDPVRSGYTFAGWTFMGDGEFNNAGDPPHSYEHGTAPGYLTANWEADSSVLYTTLVKVYDSSGSTLLKTFSASSAGSCPAATLLISDKFLSFDASTMQTETVWDYTGEGSIAGISLTPNASSPAYMSGDTMTFGGLDGQSNVVSVYIVQGEELASSVLKAGQWKCNYAVMTGEFIDLTAWPDGLSSVDLDFVSNNTSYTSMKYQYDVYSGNCLYYDDTLAYKYDTISADPSPAWRMSAFALVYFEFDQTVSQEFYDWFTSCFTYVGVDQIQPTYTSTINIYDSSGTQLLSTYSVSASGAAPVISLTVQDDGCILVYGDQTHTWSAGDADFYGFNVSPNVSLAYYSPGHAYRLPGGESADLVMDLYCVDEEPVSALPAVDFVSWLVVAVGGFLSFEFIPGFSLDRILIFCFLFGLLFWFLKISK